jgi:hypothetical protein
MLSWPRPGSGETEISPEALVEPPSGHAVVEGGVSTVCRSGLLRDSRGVVAEVVGQSRARTRRSFLQGQSRLRARHSFLLKVRPCSVARTSHPELFEHNIRCGGAMTVITRRVSS